MNLHQLFDLSLKGRRETEALEFAGTVYTFRDIDRRSDAMAALLAGRGLAKGDRLCVYLVNCVEMIDIYLACIRTGIIFVPINILYRDREILHILGDANPKAVIATQPVPGNWPVWQLNDLKPDTAEPGPRAELNGDTPAVIIYTSGTTGVSKGAVLTHNNLAANAINLNVCWGIGESDRLLLALPLFHVHGLGNGLHCWLLSGCSMRLLERFEHQRAVEEFDGYKPTVFFGVPTVYTRMLDFSPDAAKRIGKSVRLFVSGSAPLPAAVFDAFQERFGHAILERYGMTETLMNMSNPLLGERRPGTVGMPLPGVSARIVNGEIQLRGPNVFAGYWQREDATREAFDAGWFRTGDMGECSVDGYYTLLGRKSDLIISGGFNIYPREIEDFLMEQEEIAEAAVVGREDRVRGEIPVAYVVLARDISAEELTARCRKELASFKVPREFVTVEKLPRTALGKVQKGLL